MVLHLSKLYRYGRELNSHDVVKIIAIGLMVIDHVGEFLFHDNPWCRLLGRAAAPLFFFLIGYVNKLHFTTKMVVFAVILSLAQGLITQAFWVNILFMFALIEYTVWHYPPKQFRTDQRCYYFAVCLFLNIFTYQYLEYGLLGFLFVYSARMIATKDPQADIWLVLTLISYYIWESFYFRFNSNTIYLSSFAVEITLLFFLMRFYHLKTFTLPKALVLPGLFISRYSLEIYFYHLILLQSYLLFMRHIFPKIHS